MIAAAASIRLPKPGSAGKTPGMDDQAALIAVRVAKAADARFNAPEDTEEYRRDSRSPALSGGRTPHRLWTWSRGEEPLDDLADASPPVLLGDGIAVLGAVLRRQAHRAL